MLRTSVTRISSRIQLVEMHFESLLWMKSQYIRLWVETLSHVGIYKIYVLILPQFPKLHCARAVAKLEKQSKGKNSEKREQKNSRIIPNLASHIRVYGIKKRIVVVSLQSSSSLEFSTLAGLPKSFRSRLYFSSFCSRKYPENSEVSGSISPSLSPSRSHYAAVLLHAYTIYTVRLRWNARPK